MILIRAIHRLDKMFEPIPHPFGHRQADPQPLGLGHHIVQILQLELRQPPGHEIAAGHALAMLLQDRTVSKTAP